MTEKVRLERKEEMKALIPAVQMLGEYIAKYPDLFTDAQDLYTSGISNYKSMAKKAQNNPEKIVDTPSSLKKFLTTVATTIEYIYHR